MTVDQATERLDADGGDALTRAELRRRGAAAQPSGHTTQRHTARGSSILIGVVGTLGGLALLWQLIAWLCGLSLVIIVTGSMSPTMPPGTLAVVQQVEAADIRVDDVVTVPRNDSDVPVTHRVVAVEANGDGTAVLTLRGDANPIDDPEPYIVADAQRVVAALTWLGPAAGWLLSPFVRIGFVMLVAVAIVLALWPRRAERPEVTTEEETTEERMPQ
jgi:signal peptidase